MPQNDLRALLDEKIGQSLVLSMHRVALDEIATSNPHSITLDEEVTSNASDDFNCVMYALGLFFENSTYGLRARYFADTDYLESILKQGHLREITGTPNREDLAIYFSAGRVKHIGKVLSVDRITSKWGCGHVYSHGPFEVPSSYGHEIRYFSAIEPDTADLLLRRHHGSR